MHLNGAKTIGAALKFGAGYNDLEVSSAKLLFRRRVVAAATANIPTASSLCAPVSARSPSNPWPTVWVEPRVVVEVKFQDWTDDGSLRAPVFLRMRDDIDPKRVRRPKSDPIPYPSVAPHTGTEVDDIVQQFETRRATLTLAVGPHRIRLTNLDRVY